MFLRLRTKFSSIDGIFYSLHRWDLPYDQPAKTKDNLGVWSSKRLNCLHESLLEDRWRLFPWKHWLEFFENVQLFHEHDGSIWTGKFSNASVWFIEPSLQFVMNSVEMMTRNVVEVHWVKHRSSAFLLESSVEQFLQKRSIISSIHSSRNYVIRFELLCHASEHHQE